MNCKVWCQFSLLYEAIESNQFQPCRDFVASNSKVMEKIDLARHNKGSAEGQFHYVYDLFASMPSRNQDNNLLMNRAVLQKIYEKVPGSL